MPNSRVGGTVCAYAQLIAKCGCVTEGPTPSIPSSIVLFSHHTFSDLEKFIDQYSRVTFFRKKKESTSTGTGNVLHGKGCTVSHGKKHLGKLENISPCNLRNRHGVVRVILFSPG